MQPIEKTLTTTHGEVLIREAILSDAEQYRELRLNALQDSPTAFSGDYFVNLNQPMSFWENRLRVDDYGTIFFAEHAKQLIGMTVIRQRESPKTKHSADILSVYVRPEWRGLHIAESILDACTEWAKAHTVVILKLGVMAANTSAIRLYERCGFKIYGTEPWDIFYDGKYYDLHLMHRTLT